MKSMLNNIARDENCRVGAVRRYENLFGLLETNGSLRGFTVVTFKNAAEFVN